MSDPFLIEGPALISFSGGRTSGYMLHEIVRAHGGRLPDDVKVAFANTGKEREETLRFVHECGSRWGVHVHWLEWRNAKPCFEEIGYNSAARAGEPFGALIAKKKFLPNWQARFCTQFLKVEALHAFMASLGHERYAEIIGLRRDEPWRLAKMMGRNEDEARKCVAPLAKANVTRRDVMTFWAQQPFDLGLSSGEGNCDLCFMKGRALRLALIRRRPSLADWWADWEAETGGFFDRRDRYAAMKIEVEQQGDFDFDGSEEHDAECGLLCGEAA